MLDTPALPRMDKAAFLDWAEGREGRYELVEGRVEMMVGVSRAHGIIVSRLLALLLSQLDPERWTVIAEFGLDAGPKTLRYPDVVVDRAGGNLKDRYATAPALVVEVLSPSTASIDLGDKAAEYLNQPSVLGYLIFAQDDAKAWIWLREADRFPAGPHVVAGLDKIIHVKALDLAVPLAAVYAGVLPG